MFKFVWTVNGTNCELLSVGSLNHLVLICCLLRIPQYEDLLSHFSSLQVVSSSSSQIVPLRSCSNIEQYIHGLDSNSFELDLQFSSEEKRLLLLKQTNGNPWYFISFIHKFVFLLINAEMWNRTFWLNIKLWSRNDSTGKHSFILLLYKRDRVGVCANND